MSKKGGKKKKKGGDGGGGGGEELAAHPMKDLLSKEMKIMHLTEKIKIFAKETQEAHKENKDLQQQFKDYKAHQEDMQVFLNEKLDDQYNKIDELEHQIVNLKLEKKHFGSDLEAKFTDEATSLQDELTASKAKIQSLESELASLASFQKNKVELERRTAMLEDELAMVKKETQLQLVQLDRQHIRQKERMASEVKERIKETEQVTWAKWQSMYDDNTMKAMQKNKEMAIELQYQSRAAEKLMTTNARLQAKLKEAQQEIRMHKNMQGEFGKSIQTYKGQIKRLREKIERYEHDSFIDVAQPDGDGDGGAGDGTTARQRSKQAAEEKGNQHRGSSATRGSGRAAVVNLSLSGGGRRGSKGSSSSPADNSEQREQLASALKAAEAAAAEVERLKAQIAK